MWHINAHIKYGLKHIFFKHILFMHLNLIHKFGLGVASMQCEPSPHMKYVVTVLSQHTICPIVHTIITQNPTFDKMEPRFGSEVH